MTICDFCGEKKTSQVALALHEEYSAELFAGKWDLCRACKDGLVGQVRGAVTGVQRDAQAIQKNRGER